MSTYFLYWDRARFVCCDELLRSVSGLQGGETGDAERDPDYFQSSGLVSWLPLRPGCTVARAALLLCAEFARSYPDIFPSSRAKHMRKSAPSRARKVQPCVPCEVFFKMTSMC